jgi:hypothetical protein
MGICIDIHLPYMCIYIHFMLICIYLYIRINTTSIDINIFYIKSTGTYRATSYFLTKTFLEIPLTFVQTLVQFIICYFMINLQGNFIYIVLAAWGLGCASCSVAVMIGKITSLYIK